MTTETVGGYMIEHGDAGGYEHVPLLFDVSHRSMSARRQTHRPPRRVPTGSGSEPSRASWRTPGRDRLLADPGPVAPITPARRAVIDRCDTGGT